MGEIKSGEGKAEPGGGCATRLKESTGIWDEFVNYFSESRGLTGSRETIRI